MGKALPKVCSICTKTISGANWSKHKKTHTKKGEAATGIVTKAHVSLKTGRPKQEHHLAPKAIVRML